MTNSFQTHLECSVCGMHHHSGEIHTVCQKCGKTLLVKYDLQKAEKELQKEHLPSDKYSMWKYQRLLPVFNEANIVSLGEQITPLLRLSTYEKKWKAKNIRMKDEGQLPTGSFKSRGLAMAISKAKELGVKKICIPSAGNAAGAASAYAAKAGIEAFIFVPEDTPTINIKESIAYGAHVELVKGNISDAAKRMNLLRSEGNDWFDVSTLKEPYRLEGKKTMGYELAEQFNWNLPDVIFYPTGGGTGLIGMWKAFDEMEEMGWIGSKRPKMISVQSAGCAPIVRAFEEKKNESLFWENAATIASGLRVPKAFADHLILNAVYKSGGTAISVTDAEIKDAVLNIARSEGLFICPEGAATVVAMEKLIEQKFILPDESVVLFNTASGIKYPEVVD